MELYLVCVFAFETLADRKLEVLCEVSASFRALSHLRALDLWQSMHPPKIRCFTISANCLTYFRPCIRTHCSSFFPLQFQVS